MPVKNRQKMLLKYPVALLFSLISFSFFEASNTAGSLGELLPVITVIMSRMNIITEPSERVFRLFQRFWFYCVLYGFAEAENNLWLSDWYECVRSIATKSPALVAQSVSYVPLKSAMPLKAEQITKVTRMRRALISIVMIFRRIIVK